MIKMYLIKRNGKTNREMGILATRPSIPSTEYQYETYDIPGRDGQLYHELSAVKDIPIKIKFSFACKQEKWQEKFRKARKWLLKKEDNYLELSDDTDYFYIVKHTKIEESEREVKEIGEFEVEFICDGYQYLKTGLHEYEKEEILYNPYAIAHPVYFITGNGKCTLTVNGKEMTAEVGQNLTINTDLMLAYRKDGTIRNTAVKGDYQDLFLQEGDNTITITNGFKLKVRPNWRSL